MSVKKLLIYAGSILFSLFHARFGLSYDGSSRYPLTPPENPPRHALNIPPSQTLPIRITPITSNLDIKSILIRK
ncbi:hypothetical protein V8C26DRAFT_414749 [Trichoderma gracile]